MIEHEEVFVAEMSPDPVSAPPPVVSPLPETRSEAVSLLITMMTEEKWKEVIIDDKLITQLIIN